MLIVVISDVRHKPITQLFFYVTSNTPFYAIYYNQPYKCMQKHSEKIFFCLHLITSHKNEMKHFCITSVLQQNNISPIFSIENILFA